MKSFLQLLDVTDTNQSSTEILRLLYQQCDPSTGRDINNPLRRVQAPKSRLTEKAVLEFIAHKGLVFMKPRGVMSALTKDMKGALKMQQQNYDLITTTLELYEETEWLQEPGNISIEDNKKLRTSALLLLKCPTRSTRCDELHDSR